MIQASDKQLARAEKLAEVERNILAALKPLKPLSRVRVFRAACILRGIEISVRDPKDCEG
jgi:hypothetical protein